MKQTRRELVAITTFALFAACVAAQNAAAPPKLAFEVASIKPAGPLDPMAMAQGKVRMGMTVDGAICNIASLSLKELIRIAYEVKDLQISGAESLGTPLEAQRFNIQATMPPGATQKEVPQMLQALLAERFALVVHRETKDQSVYALVVAKGGPKMKETPPDAPPPAGSDEPKKGETGAAQGGQVGFSGNPADGKGMTLKGGPMGQMHMTMVDGKMRMEAEKMTMPILAEIATTFVGKPVMDMTELKGSYQVALDLALSELLNVARNAGMPVPAGAPGGNPGEASDPSGSSIFASVQQMGLKLEQRKVPLPFIVIDHVEKTPTEN